MTYGITVALSFFMLFLQGLLTEVVWNWYIPYIIVIPNYDLRITFGQALGLVFVKACFTIPAFEAKQIPLEETINLAYGGLQYMVGLLIMSGISRLLFF